MSRWCVRCAIVGLKVLLLGGVIGAKEIQVTAITPDKNVGQWRVEEATGRVFATLPEDDAVAEYNPDTGKEVRRFAVAGNPGEVIIKGRWLVAACTKTIALSVVDLKTNKVLGSVQLAGRGPYALFCSKAENSYAYAICNTGDAWWDGEVFQVDLGQQQVRKRVKVQGWRQSHPIHVVMSRDGKFIVPDARGASSPSGGDLMSVDEETLTFQNVVNHHESFGQAVADPSGRWWTLGNLLFPLDLSASVRNFTGSPVAIHPTLDLAASLRGSELFLETFTEAKLIKSISLTTGEQQSAKTESTGKTARTGKMTAAERAERTAAERAARMAADRAARARDMQYRGDPTLQFDLAGNRIVCGVGPKAYVVGLADLGVTIRPRLEIQGPSRVSVTMGQTQRVPLSAGDAKDSAKTTLKVASGPAFAKIEGSELVLSPTAKALGRHDVVVKAERGNLSDSLTIAVTVGVPSVELGCIVRGVAVDREGRHAVAWGPKGTPQPSRPAPEPATEGPMIFAVIDLDGPSLTSTQSVSSGIQQLAVDDKYIYLNLASGNLLYRIERADLTQRKRIYLDGTPLRLAALPDKHLAVLFGDSHQPVVQVFDRDTLKRNPKHYGDRALGFSPDEGPSFWEPVGDGALRFCERIIDAQTGTLRCLLEPVRLPRLVQTAMSGGGFPGRGRSAQRLWGRTIQGNTLASPSGSRIATLPGMGQISPDCPLAVCLRSAYESNRQKTYLEFRSLKLGEIIQATEIGGPSPEERHFEYGGQSRFHLVKNKVVLPQGNRLLVSPISADLRKDLPVPLLLKYPQIEVASVDKPVSVQLAAVGGEGAPSYALTREYEGLTIDSVSGKVTIDLPLLWKKHLVNLQKPAAGFPSGEPFAQRTADDKGMFERLTGEALPAGKMAFALPAEVAVSDQAGEQDRLALSVIALAPAGEVQKIVAARQAELERQREQARQETLKRQQEFAAREAAGTGRGPGAKADADRIEQLENRVRRLEAGMDAILRKIDRLEPASGAKEAIEPGPAKTTETPQTRAPRPELKTPAARVPELRKEP